MAKSRGPSWGGAAPTTTGRAGGAQMQWQAQNHHQSSPRYTPSTQGGALHVAVPCVSSTCGHPHQNYSSHPLCFSLFLHKFHKQSPHVPWAPRSDGAQPLTAPSCCQAEDRHLGSHASQSKEGTQIPSSTTFQHCL